MLVDSHCHLDFPELIADIDGVLERANAAGVVEMLAICTRLDRFPDILELAATDDRLWCSVGVHPHEADDAGVESPEVLLAEVDHAKVVAIGETGLDFYYETSSREAQQRSFRHHISAARTSGLPIVIHSRDADDEMAAILTQEMEQGAFGGVIHCFTASQRLAEVALSLGLYISFSGIVTFKNAQDIRDVAQMVPIDRLLIETDAPYLAPIPHRGKCNEPAFVADTAAYVAGLRGINRDALAEVTTRNFHTLFEKTRSG
jgi:TatD DNase family protein